MSQWEWRGVLAAVYRGGQQERALRAHLVEIGTCRVACRKIPRENMSDATDGNSPRCQTCRRRSLGVDIKHRED